MEKVSIIVVDDHTMFLEGVQAILSNQDDMEVIGTANNGVTALKLLSKQLPDIIITDISMPEMNGIEFIKKIKNLYPTVKILAVSMFERIEKFTHIDGYLLKETGYEELLVAIRNIVLKDEKYFKNDIVNEEVKLEFNKTILTKREKEIVVLIANELTVDEIADQLFLSRHTVETHKKNIFFKLQVNNVAGLIKRAIYLGYL